jgi:hypothetical protein
MADKRISQLVERTDIANNDVVPIVAFGATTTNKATISSIQEFMQENLDLGVTSVGITLGSSGTDVNVTGSPITTSGNITINIPDASATARGVVTTGTQTFAGAKTFSGGINSTSAVLTGALNGVNASFTSTISSQDRIQTDTIFSVKHNSTVFTLNGYNSIQGNINSFAVYNGTKGMRINFPSNESFTHTLPDASGTLALTSDLTGYVTLGTAQTITAQKTFTTSGSSDTMIISHGSGSGIALDVIKAGNGEAIRIQKTSGTGNAVTITGGTLSAEAGQFSGDVQTATRFAASSGSNGITITPNVGGTQNRIETTGSLPLSLVSAAAITLAAGGTTPQITLATTGAVTLTGALNGTSAAFSSSVTAASGINAIGQEKAFSWQRTEGTESDVYSLNANSSRAYLQNDTTSNVLMVWQEGGNVGIGTVSPGAQLDISTDVSATGAILRLSNQSNSILADQPHGTIQFFSGDNSSPADSVVSSIISAQSTTSPNEAYLSFLTGNNTEKMRITSAGNVGIGTASPAASLDVIGASGTEQFRIGNTTGGTDFGITVTENATTIINSAEGATGRGIQFQSGGSNTMLINSAGNVGIGTASPSAPLTITSNASGDNTRLIGRAADGFSFLTFRNNADTTTNGNIGVSDSQNMIFYTSTTERMRITSAGDVMIGNALSPVSSRGELRIGGNSAGSRISMGISGTNYSALVTDSGGNVYLVNEFNDSAIKLLMINFNNGVYLSQSATSWTSNSDERLKNINGTIENAVDKLMTLRAVNYSWKNDENQKENLGLIAQDVEKVFPEVIDSNTLTNLDENEDADKTEYLGVRYQELVPVLIKAIQELKTEIDSLKNQIK